MQRDYSYIVNDSLKIVTESLQDYVEDKLRLYYPDKWKSHLPQQVRVSGEIVRWDAQAVLHTIAANWKDTFSFDGDKNTRNLVGELIDWRNRAAHVTVQESITPDDAYRAVDTAWRLLVRLAPEQAEKLMPLKDEIKHLHPGIVVSLPDPSPSQPKFIQKSTGQRNTMRRLVEKHGRDAEKVINEYAAAEHRGEVTRNSNSSNLSPIEYARALWLDGCKKGWL